MRVRGTREDTRRVVEWQECIKHFVIELALEQEDHCLTVSDVQNAAMAGLIPAPPEVSDPTAKRGQAFSNLLRNIGFQPTGTYVPSTFPPAKRRKVCKWYYDWQGTDDLGVFDSDNDDMF